MMFQSGDIVVTNIHHEQDVVATVDQVMGNKLLVEVDGSLYEVSQDDTEFYVPPYKLDRFDILQDGVYNGAIENERPPVMWGPF